MYQDYLNRILKSQKAVTALNAFIGVLIILAALFLARDIVSTVLSSKTKPTKVGQRIRTVTRHNFQDYAAIMTNNPFGFQAGDLTLLTSSAGSAPLISPTDVILLGTIAGRSDLSYAIIADKTGKQDVYRVGDNVLGFGKLAKVEKDKIVIKSNGRDVDIPLADITVVEEAKSAAPGQFGKKTGESSYLVDKARIQQAIDKPDQIMTDARLLPNIVDGKQQGFVLREVKPGGIYNSLGLQSGDVLLRINEFNISNPESALQAFTALRGIDRVELDMIRNGSKMTMTYQIR